MKNTIATIIGTGVIAIGGTLAVVDTTPSAQSAQVEKVSTSTISVKSPVEVDIKNLKEELRQAQEWKKQITASCEDSLSRTQAKIDETKDIIKQAKDLGVE